MTAFATFARLRARRARVAYHRVEHLRRHYDGLALHTAALDYLLLYHRHVLGAHLHSEVAARDHHAVDDLKYCVEVVDGLARLHLRDYLRRRARGFEDAAHLYDVLLAAHEGNRDVVDVVLRAPPRPI